MMIDTHCHIQFTAFDSNRDEVLARCRERGVIMNLVGTQRDTSEAAVRMASEHDIIYATVGLHPIHEYEVPVVEESTTFTSRGEVFDPVYYRELASHPKVIAIGETGLDKYHIPDTVSEDEVLAVQRQIFRAHYDLASELGLPLVLHVRDAHDEMIALLSSIKTETRQLVPGVVHCFTGTHAHARAYLDLGFYLGFTGIITFPPKKTDPTPQLELIRTIQDCPLDRILVETDAPFLAPQAYRGKTAEPWMVEEVIKKIAEIREMSVDDVMRIVEENSRRLFPKMV